MLPIFTHALKAQETQGFLQIREITCIKDLGIYN